MKIFCLTLLTALSGLTWAELDLKQLCFNKSLNEVVSHPQDCRGYIMCSMEPSVHYCDLGFHFDIKRLVCNRPENVICQLLSETVAAAPEPIKPEFTSFMALDIMTGEVIDAMIGYDPLNVICRHFGAYFLPNPHRCRYYYLCAYGHIHEHACGSNTLWDYKAQQCVLNHKAICYHLTVEEANEINESFANNMQNSSLVCYAVNTTTATSTLEPFPNQTEPISSTTTAIPTPPTMLQPSSKKPNLSNPYNIICPPRRQSYVAHPKECNKYFMCILGTPIMTSCPEGLLWESKKEYCDLSKNVKCLQEQKL